ncbi:MAG: site-specific DNA-methyltransferase [Desulfobacteraceae bacterium]|nr:site-specific DNA-methyltransferase [Desulfobacteraceae bacterium]
MPEHKIQTLDPKTDGSSKDIVQENIEKLKEIFPEIFTEDKIDFHKLKETLGDYTDTQEDRYNFTWHGKSSASRIAQTPSTGTLRPCKEESKNWETTGNLFIEGDNLEVLKLLQKSYHKKIKMIYIDPPYNTGKEFIYPDNYKDNLNTYLKYSGQIDDEGCKFSSNSEQSGRYHTNWLNMMYPRLKLARNLLRDDGVIFISIDDNEQSNLKKICDEIFGEDNFVAVAIWQKVFSPKNTAAYFSEDHDYILIYAKRKDVWSPQLLPRSEEAIARYKNPDEDPRGIWSSGDLTARNFYGQGQYDVIGPTGKKFGAGKGRYWRQNYSKFKELDADNRIWWGEDKNNMPRLKRFISEVKAGVVPQTLLLHTKVGNTQEAKKELLKYAEFNETANVLNSVKPTRLLRHLLKIASTPDKNEIILDFFAGSASLGHAVIAQNHEDKGNRKFILVQLPEPLPKDEPNVKTIADLGKSRLNKVSASLKKCNSFIGKGYKVFKLDSSNIKPWDADFDNLEKALFDSVENIKKDRTQDDVLYELQLKYGFDLTGPIEEKIIEGKTIYIIDFGALVICLDSDITIDVVEGIGKLKKELKSKIMRVVFKDNGFKTDVVKTNAIQILKQYKIEDVKSL